MYESKRGVGEVVKFEMVCLFSNRTIIECNLSLTTFFLSLCLAEGSAKVTSQFDLSKQTNCHCIEPLSGIIRQISRFFPVFLIINLRPFILGSIFIHPRTRFPAILILHSSKVEASCSPSRISQTGKGEIQSAKERQFSPFVTSPTAEERDSEACLASERLRSAVKAWKK